MAAPFIFYHDSVAGMDGVYAILHSPSGIVSNIDGSVLTRTSGHWDDAHVPLADSACAKHYIGNAPLATVADDYLVLIYRSATPGVTYPVDPTDQLLGSGQLTYDGAKMVRLLDVYNAAATHGDGDTPVDHDTGGTDNLLYSHEGTGVGGAIVRAYLASEFAGGDFVERGRSVTGDDGRWLQPMYLNTGFTYTITFVKVSVSQVSAVNVAV